MKTNQNIQVISGDTTYFLVNLFDPDNQPLDPNDYPVIIWRVVDPINSDRVHITKNLSSGITITGANQIRIDLEPADTESLAEKYLHEIEIIDVGSNTYTILQGQFRVVKDLINNDNFGNLNPGDVDESFGYELVDLVDVNITNPEDGQYLTYSNGDWVNSDTIISDPTLSALSGLDSTAGLVEQLGADSFTKRVIGVGSASSIPTRSDADTRYAALSHSHTSSDITNFSTAVDARISLQKAAANGIATLDSSGKVPTNQLPAYVDVIEEYNELADFPVTGDIDIIYLALDTGFTYRWSGSTYVQITAGAVDSVNGQTGAVILTTANISENTNLYFTDERAQDAVGGILVSSGTITLTYTDLSNTITASIIAGSISDSHIASGINANKIADGSISNTEYQYLNGVSSNIQTQIDNKQTLDATLTSLSGLDSTTGLIEQTGVDTFTKRAIGVGSASSIPTRSDADTRYAANSHTHTAANITNFNTAVLSAIVDVNLTEGSTINNNAIIQGIGVSKITVSSTEPTSPAIGDLWVDIS